MYNILSFLVALLYTVIHTYLQISLLDIACIPVFYTVVRDCTKYVQGTIAIVTFTGMYILSNSQMRPTHRSTMAYMCKSLFFYSMTLILNSGTNLRKALRQVLHLAHTYWCRQARRQVRNLTLTIINRYKNRYNCNSLC